MGNSTDPHVARRWLCRPGGGLSLASSKLLRLGARKPVQYSPGRWPGDGPATNVKGRGFFFWFCSSSITGKRTNHERIFLYRDFLKRHGARCEVEWATSCGWSRSTSRSPPVLCSRRNLVTGGGGGGYTGWGGSRGCMALPTGSRVGHLAAAPYSCGNGGRSPRNSFGRCGGYSSRRGCRGTAKTFGLLPGESFLDFGLFLALLGCRLVEFTVTEVNKYG